MPPNTTWAQITKSQIKLNHQGTEWKSLMNECLIKTEIFNEKDLNCFKCPALDPNVVMNMRHEIAKIQDFSKSYPTPKEKIQTEATKLLREENHKKLLKQKEEKLITKEIERLKTVLENRRLVTQKIVQEKPKTSTVVRRHAKFRKRVQSYGGVCEVDIWQSSSVQMTMETKISESGIPFDVQVRMERKEKEEEEEEEAGWSEPVSCRKGSLTEEQDNRFFKGSGFLEEVDCLDIDLNRSYLKEKEGTEESINEKEFEEDYNFRKLLSAGSNITNRRKIEHAWKVWRIYTLSGRKRKQEKAIYENKIDVFFSKLQEKMNEVQERPKTHPSRKPNLVERAKTALAASKQHREQNRTKTQEKVQKLRELVKDIKASREEATERILSFNPRRAEFMKKECPEQNFLLRMENRREERSNRWKEIRERKLKLEEEKEKKKKEKEEEIKAQEENEKKRKLEEVKEKRRLEKEKIEKARREKEKLKAQEIQSESYYEKFLMRAYGIRPWLSLLRLKFLQEEQAVAFMEKRLQRRAFDMWRVNAREAVEEKEEKADRLLVRRCLVVWANVPKERVKQWQVAVDWEELRLTERMFKCWVKFTQEEQLEEVEKKDVADFHNKMKLKLKYLRIWQTYPEIKRLEAAKENRKRIWRQRVLEILPDYQPIQTSDDF